MSRTITAMFDTRADADAGRERLLAAHLDADNVRVHGQSGTGDTGGGQSTDSGMWSSIKNAFLPDEDRHTYEEGARRGGFILSADVDEAQIDDAVRVLEDANSVDIDERSAQWKSEGWNNPAAAGLGVPAAMSDRSRGAMPMTTDGDEQTLQVVEERLVVGKRDVDRGGVRVRSYVTEKAVHEQVRLRNESINVERRPVDQPLSSVDGDAFRERTIDMTATGEEAVVGKTARVVEEVVVRKSADERVEDINETVRRTDVDVDNIAGSDGSALSDRLPGSVTPTKTATDTATGLGDKAAGLGKEALGNLKQGVGGITGNESLKRDGAQQERSGEMQQGKLPGDNR